MRIKNDKGFTLIEIIMIITIIGIITAISVPKYQDFSLEAKRAACKTSLNSMRGAVSSWQMQNIVKNNINEYPDIHTLETQNEVLIDIPPNPFQHPDNAPDSIVEGTTKGIVIGSRGGWAYNAATGEIWANTSTTIGGSGCTGETIVNENEW